jgi:hypothetical protein
MTAFVYREPIKIIGDILQSELTLNPGQVMDTNQKYEIPTNGLYIACSYVGPAKVIASMSEWADDGAGGITELQSITMLHLIQIDIMSFANDARMRKEEIVMALRSFFAQSQMETYNMQIARQPGPLMDTSYLEETKMITRYTTTIITSSVNQKQKPASSYNSFSGEFFADDPNINRAIPVLTPPVLPFNP